MLCLTYFFYPSETFNIHTVLIECCNTLTDAGLSKDSLIMILWYLDQNDPISKVFEKPGQNVRHHLPQLLQLSPDWTPHLHNPNSTPFWHRSGGMSSRLMLGWQSRSPASTRESRPTCSEFTWTRHKPSPTFPLPTLALTCVFVHLGIINSTEHCLAYCMFLDVGNVLRMARLLLCYYAGNLAIMNARNQLYSYLYVPQRSPSTNVLFISHFGQKYLPNALNVNVNVNLSISL